MPKRSKSPLHILYIIVTNGPVSFTLLGR